MTLHHLLARVAICAAAALSCVLTPPAWADSKSTSVTIDNDEGKVTMHGDGVANILGDKVESKNGTVFINGVSFGSVPAGSEVKYVVTKSARTLFVDGKARGPAANK